MSQQPKSYGGRLNPFNRDTDPDKWLSELQCYCADKGNKSDAAYHAHGLLSGRITIFLGSDAAFDEIETDQQKFYSVYTEEMHKGDVLGNPLVKAMKAKKEKAGFTDKKLLERVLKKDLESKFGADYPEIISNNDEMVSKATEYMFECIKGSLAPSLLTEFESVEDQNGLDAIAFIKNVQGELSEVLLPIKIMETLTKTVGDKVSPLEHSEGYEKDIKRINSMAKTAGITDKKTNLITSLLKDVVFPLTLTGNPKYADVLEHFQKRWREEKHIPTPAEYANKQKQLIVEKRARGGTSTETPQAQTAMFDRDILKDKIKNSHDKYSHQKYTDGVNRCRNCKRKGHDIDDCRWPGGKQWDETGFQKWVDEHPGSNVGDYVFNLLGGQGPRPTGSGPNPKRVWNRNEQSKFNSKACQHCGKGDHYAAVCPELQNAKRQKLANAVDRELTDEDLEVATTFLKRYHARKEAQEDQN